MQEYLNKIDKDRLPEHIAVIMDGNGRWAKAHGKPRVFGHKNGVKSVREISEAAAELGIGYLTLYAFSTENWSRPAFEVTALMGLLVETIRNEVSTLNKNNIRLRAIGDLSKLPKKSQNALLEGIDKTSNNTGLTLILALNYSSRWEITSTIQKIAQAAKDGLVDPDKIDETFISHQLATADYPDPELLIRTSGEQRISNYLLWQIAYSELYFTDVFWPDFRKVHLYKALVNYQGRERRFGKTSEQVK
ncbi:MAG: undecaprenyl diphosphate synthase [Saprospiraceae bacterium]|jgi:undecaprenyl diphosphate synthase|tara:strand:+ start:448 stop:1191 length:744 start_codon:yes stop_codon:yes gene_type:complete